MAMRAISEAEGNLRKISGILSQWCKESMLPAYRLTGLQGTGDENGGACSACSAPLRLERKRGAKPVSVEETDILRALTDRCQPRWARNSSRTTKRAWESG